MKPAHLLNAGKISLLKSARALRTLSLALLFAIGTAAIALAVVFPLWYFATRHTRGYTLLAMLTLLGILLYSVGRALVRSARLRGSFLAVAREKLLPPVITILIFLFFLCSLYGIIFLYANRRLAAAITASVIYPVLALIVTHFRRRNT